MEWLMEALKGLENAEELEKKITGGIGKNFVSRLDFNALNTTKKELESKISELQATDNDAERFKTELEALKRQIADEKAAAELAAKEAAKEADFQNRFNSVVGENKWRDELTQNAVFSEFKKALADAENKGKGDKDILEALTKDKNYYIEPSNEPVFASGTGGGTDYNIEEARMRAIMGLSARE